MRRVTMRNKFFLVFLLLLTILSASCKNKLFTIRVDLTSNTQIEEIKATGIKIMEEYPAYIIGMANTKQFDRLIEKKMLAVKLPIGQIKDISNNKTTNQLSNIDEETILSEEIAIKNLKNLDKSYHYYFVEFKGQLTDKWKEEIQLKDIECLEYYHSNTYILRSKEQTIDSLKTFPFVSKVTEHKIQ